MSALTKFFSVRVNVDKLCCDSKVRVQTLFMMSSKRFKVGNAFKVLEEAVYAILEDNASDCLLAAAERIDRWRRRWWWEHNSW